MEISHTELFRDIEEKDMEALLSCLSAFRKEYKKGEVILQEGEPTEKIGVVLSGMAIISCSDVWGNTTILGNASPGAVFGEAYACVPGEPLLISVVAAEDTAVLFMHIGKALSTCGNACVFHTKLIRNLLRVCAEKSLQLSRRILHTGSKSIRGRLLSYFSECVKRTGSYSFSIPYSRQQLADYLGVDRSALSNELSKMRRDGLIQYEKNSFTVLKPHIV